jgi:DNA topoisomerase-1
VPRLRRVDCSEPGITRRRRGRGFEYVDERGERITDEDTIARIRDLAIPPAWEEVWICPVPNGHIQATGVDAAGRKQYRYHDRWRERRDQQKFDQMLDFARALPAMRERVEHDLQLDDLERDRVLACAVRLLDRGFFRVGGEDYAEENESFGLATMLKEHVSVRGDEIEFDYPAKSGRRHLRSIVDEDIGEIVAALRRRRGGGPELLAYREGRRWHDLRSEDVNEYVKRATGADHSAKDFRTWNATLLAAVALAVSGVVAGASKTARKRAKARAVDEVARYLGNTPAVARSSYIDPRVFDRFDAGLTIGPAVAGLVQGDDVGEPHIQKQLESAVLDLIGEEASAEVEKVA